MTVFRTNDPALVGVIKSLLDSVQIDYFLRGESYRNVMGWQGTLNSAVGEAEFLVRESDAEQATALLKELHESADPGPSRNA